MAGSSGDQRRRHADDMDAELEEGEYVPGPAGYHSESDTEEYYNHSSSDSDNDVEATSKTRWLFVATSNGEASCSSPVAARSSELAANSNGYPSASSRAFAAAAPALLVCRVCGKQFASSKAVCGHMKVHALEQGSGGKQEASLAVGWGGTGKRGCSELVLELTPLAYAATNLSPSVPVASAETDRCGEGGSARQVHDDAMAVVVAGAYPPPPPPTEAAVHHQSALPPPLPAAAEYQQAPPAVHQGGSSQNPSGYECGAWFSNHQALGGHVAGHRNRRIAAEARRQGGAAPTRGGGANQERLHRCVECAAVFAMGVQLGGHMRKHWKGEPIKPKKKLRLTLQPLPPPHADDLAAPQLRLGLSFEADVRSPAPDVERAQPAQAPAPMEETVEAVQPAPSPAPTEGTTEAVQPTPATDPVILFGVDIGPSAKRPRSREGSPTEDSADVGGQQQ